MKKTVMVAVAAAMWAASAQAQDACWGMSAGDRRACLQAHGQAEAEADGRRERSLGEEQIAILLFLLLLGVLAVVLGRQRRSRRQARSSTATSRRGDGATVVPFDAKTATPTLDHPVLEGTAHVIDGDTVVIRKTQVRLFGIDAPEMNHPYGKNAKWALVSLCKGQTVRAEVTEQDAYGRTVARCFLRDGRDLSAEMVKLGLAIDWAKYSGGQYRSLEVHDARKRLWLADARQKGHMHVWEQFERKQRARSTTE